MQIVAAEVHLPDDLALAGNNPISAREGCYPAGLAHQRQRLSRRPSRCPYANGEPEFNVEVGSRSTGVESSVSLLA
ncbi:MAG: hypothetical protein ACLR9W_10390 [Enterobacter hormaechei]